MRRVARATAHSQPPRVRLTARTDGAIGRGLMHCRKMPILAANEFACPTDIQRRTARYGPDRDCGDFRTHAEAQAFFIAAGGPGTDRHRLDADRDGIACETLP